MPATRRTITVTETVRVDRPPEDVFEFTQDYGRRSEWDTAVTESHVVGDSPRRIRIAVRGLGRFTVAYRLFRRPERTSAAFVDVESRWISGGGGSWQYEPIGDATEWTQTNTLELTGGWLTRILGPLFARNLRASMRAAMARAKSMMESGTARGSVS